ncbi:carbon-nitrogen hydrolase family protein [Rhodovibrionaceae bacterium A322]
MTSDDDLRLLACQITIPPMTKAEERDDHLANSTQKVQDKLKDEAVDLVALPELSSVDYARETFECLDLLAEDLEGPSFQAWQKVARENDVFVSYSFPRKDPNGPFISIAVVGPDGQLVGHYDKLHLAQYGASMEKEYFRRGGQLFTFTVKGFRLAPIICYDIRIPELCRTLTLDHQVDAILHCGAYYRDPSFPTWHAFAVTRALENQIYFLSLNRAGEHYGDSLFCQPWQDESIRPLSFDAQAEDLKVVTLERAALDQARRDYTFLGDRLDSYDLPLKRG